MKMDSDNARSARRPARAGTGLGELAPVGALAAALAVVLLLDDPLRVPVAGALGAAGIVAAFLLAQRRRATLAAVREGLDRLRRGRHGTPVPLQGGAEAQRLAESVNALAKQWLETTARADARELALVNTLSHVAEGRSPASTSHVTRIGLMSRALARLAGLPDQEAELLRQAAPLHDIGKAGVPEAILAKQGSYTPREREAMKAHAELGHRILAGSPRPELRAAAVIALTHHERWDGLGYPRGLAGEDIPLHGRIVGLVDAFDAMFCERTYRRAMSRDHGLGIIRSQRGHHFDPRLVDLLLENLPVFFGIVEEHMDRRPARKAAGAPHRKPSALGV
jgi:HD-GYP domain-containing protein (c-di-GMP phosphodiesterase class II)